MNSSEQEKFMPYIGGAAPTEPVEKPLSAMTADLMNEAAMDPFAGISERKRFNTGSLILAGVIVAAGAGLWFMRSLSKAGAASIDTQAEANVEKFISSLTGKAAPGAPSSQVSVLAVLSGSYAERQVPLSAVQRNPFILFDEALAPTPTSGGDGDPNLTRKQADRRTQFEKAAAKLEVKSVLMSATPLANVSGKIVRQGDEIVTADQVVLRVAEITKDAVRVVGEDAAVQLNVSFTIPLKR